MMHKFLMSAIFGVMLVLGSGMLSSSWAAIIAPDDSIMPCDKVKIDDRPCSTDTDSIKTPEPIPTEKNSIVIPPEIPAEKLPDRNKKQPRSNTREPDVEPPRY